MRTALAAAALCLPIAWSPPLGAQPRDPVAAQVLFEEGHAAFTRGDLATACAKFSASQRLDPAGGTLINLADCEERSGRLALAWLHWRESIAMFEAQDPRLALARQRSEALDARVPRLTLVLAPGAPPATRVTRDGAGVEPAGIGVAVPVDPGAHRVTVIAPNSPPRHYDVHLAEGERRVLELDPRPPAATSPEAPIAPRPPAPAAPAVPADRAWPWAVPVALGGGTLALGIAGGALAVFTSTHYSDLAETCARVAGGCPQSDRDAPARRRGGRGDCNGDIDHGDQHRRRAGGRGGARARRRCVAAALLKRRW
jgi:hypothetical protein